MNMHLHMHLPIRLVTGQHESINIDGVEQCIKVVWGICARRPAQQPHVAEASVVVCP
jgi:hypothetical protein